MSKARICFILSLAALALVACSSTSHSTGSTGAGGASAVSKDDLVFESAPFTIQPGQEMYVCTTMTVNDATAIDRFTYEATPGVHHLALVNPVVAEQAGSFECDVLFKQT